MKSEIFISKEYVLQKYPGKGGWTYALIPEIPQDRKAHFGWVTVSGSIDNYKLERIKLMPDGNGHLFLPVKAAIRKKIKKEAGDTVFIELSTSIGSLDLPEEIKLCFENEPADLHATFRQLSESEQQAYLDWIYAAKKEATKVERIVLMMEKLAAGIG